MSIMADDRKGGYSNSTHRNTDHLLLTRLPYLEDEATIKVASKKNPPSGKAKMGALKIKEKFPKIKEAGDYERGQVLEGACTRYALNPICRTSTDRRRNT